MAFSTIKNIGMLCFLLFFYKVGVAQFHHGIEAGILYNNADFMIGESQEPSGKTGFTIGYSAERDLSDNLYVRLGVTFNRRALRAQNIRGINTSQETWKHDAIEVPVNLGYYVNWNNRNLQFFVEAGAILGYNSRVSFENDEESVRLDIGGNGDIKRLNTGANASIGLLIKHRFKVRIQYYYGLGSMISSENDIWKNRTFGLSINYFLKERPPVY